MNKKTVNIIGEIAKLFGVVIPKISIESTVLNLQKLYNIEDVKSYKVGLENLYKEVISSDNLTTFGRYAFKNDLENLLLSRFTLQNHMKLNLENYKREISDPIVILGLPRTGTTLLHALLALDHQFRAPLVWEFNLAPSPPSLLKEENKDRIEKTQKAINFFKKTVPEINQIHLYDAELPQECIFGTAIDFKSIYFEAKYIIPEYQKWYKNVDKYDTFVLHKKVLQYLQTNSNDKTWLLKSPAFLGELPELFATYPNARIIQTHRDVNKVLHSISGLYYTLRKTFYKHVDKEKTGDEMINIWSERMEKNMNFRDENSEKNDLIFDLDFSDFMKSPVDSIRMIYCHFNLEFTQQTEKEMISFLKVNKRSKTAEVVKENFGLMKRKEEILKRFERYNKRHINTQNDYE